MGILISFRKCQYVKCCQDFICLDYFVEGAEDLEIFNFQKRKELLFLIRDKESRKMKS
jgi:hypothetical protein